MRHYEIAANHTAPCFYNLSKKPKHCAPHGLVDMENIVAFDTAEELKKKIDYIKNSIYILNFRITLSNGLKATVVYK